MMSNAAAKVSGITQSDRGNNTQFKKPHNKLKFDIFVALPRRQLQDYTEIHVFYHMMSNAAAKVSGLT